MLLALAIISTVLVCTQPIPSRHIRTDGDTFWIFINIAVTITTIWVLYAHIS